MNATTFQAIQSLLKTDTTLTPAERKRIGEAVQNHGEIQNPALPCLISRKDAAKLLNRTPRSVDHLAEQGILPRVLFPGRQRAAGFRKGDVVALIEGKR